VAASFWSHRGVGALGWKLWPAAGAIFRKVSGPGAGMVLVEQCGPARRTQAGYNQPVRHLVGTAVERSIAGVAVFEGEGNPLRLRCSLVPHALGERGKRCRVRKIAALRMARTCYDHLAGRLGVALADALVRGRSLGARK
jgi:hypothetical protein